MKTFEGTPGGYSWASPRDPALLDYMGAEFILIGANPDIGTLRQGFYLEMHGLSCEPIEALWGVCLRHALLVCLQGQCHLCLLPAAPWRCAGQVDKKVQEHLEKTAEQDLEKHTGGGDEDEEMLAKLRAELHAEKNHVETAPAVEGTMK